VKRATVLSCRKSFRLVHSGGLSGEDREPAYSLADNLRSGIFFFSFFCFNDFFLRRTGKEKEKKDRLISGYLLDI